MLCEANRRDACLGKDSLNPCYSGICSVSLGKDKHPFAPSIVLILVIVEYAL